MDEDAFNSARRQILNNAVRRSQKSLDLSSKNLSALPSEIGRAVTLKKLSINDNELNLIPDSFRFLSELLELDAHSNRLTDHFSIIGQLRSLEILILYSNNIDKISPEISGLRNLKRLDLSDNPLISLPSEIDGLINLESLDLSYTRLTALPDSFRRLRNLKSLDLSGTDISSLPDGIGDLEELEYLDISNCKLKELPSSISKLERLKFLNISHNPLSIIPVASGKLSRLSSLFASGLESVEDLSFINGLSQLQNLQLARTNGIAISKLQLNSSIHTLNVSECDLTDLPSGIAFKLSLRKADLSDNQLKSIPKDLLKCRLIMSLNLSGNFIDEIPTEIFSLKLLSDLDLSNNRIDRIPSNILDLVRLRSLNLESNRLTEIPDVIGFMPSLKRAVEEDVEPFTEGIHLNRNPLSYPLNIISQQDQPEATNLLQSYLRGELDPSIIEELETNQGFEPSQSALPDTPHQGPGPHFEINEAGVIGFTSPDSLDKHGNNLRRLESVHPIIKELTAEARKGLDEGNAPHYHLLERLKRYSEVANQELSAIDFNILYAEGVRLANAEASARAGIKSGDLPDFDPKNKEALSSLLQLHGVFIMATKDGLEAIAEEERYKRNPQEELLFRRSLVELARNLQSERDLIDRRAADFIVSSTEELSKGENPERSYVVATGAVRNASIVIATAGAFAAAATVPSLVSANMPAFLATTSSLIAAKALEKSKPFQEIQTLLAGGIDRLSEEARFERLKDLSGKFSPYLRIIMNNENRLKSLASFGLKFDWANSYFRWIKKEKR